MTSEGPSGGRAWARIGFLLGAAGSLAGNVQAAWLPYGTTDTLHGRPPWAQTAAALMWPAILIVTIEVTARITWPSATDWRNAGWTLTRFGALLSIAGSSAVISYGHVREVLDAWGYGSAATAGAVCLDGVMVFCGFAMLAADRVIVDDPAEFTVSTVAVLPSGDGRVDTATDAAAPVAAPGGEELAGPPAPPAPAPPSAPVVHLPGAPARTRVSAASAPGRPRVSAPAGAPSPALGRTDEALASALRPHLGCTSKCSAECTPECTSVRRVAAALRIGQERAGRVLDLARSAPASAPSPAPGVHS